MICPWKGRRRPGPRVEPPPLSRRERRILELLLAGGEMGGLELVKTAPGLSRGGVYVALSRMAEKGVVASRRLDAAPGSPLPKRLFRATGQVARVFAPAPRLGLRAVARPVERPV